MELQQKNGILHNNWITAISIALLLMGKYLFISTRSTLWDRDEPRFARATVEMVESGNYLVPTFNGEVWPDKPILSYWLMSVPIRLFGPTEFACRFWAAFGTALTCLLTFFIGKHLLGIKAGLWAMLILASTLMMLCIGTIATIDAMLLPFMVAVLAIFIHAMEFQMRPYHIVLMGVALGLGILAKGPIGILPIPVIVTTLWLARKVKPHPSRYLWQVGTALIIAILIFLAWAIPANNATEGEFLRIFIGRHVITRAIKPMEHHGGQFLLYLPYYLPVIILGFFPWTLHLPGAFSAILGRSIGGQYCRPLLIGWIISIFTIMTLAITKLPHYILFIWPALALAVAGTIVAAQQNRLTPRDRIWLRRGVWLFAPLSIGAAICLMIGPWFLPISGLQWSCFAAGIVLLAVAGTAIHLQRTDKPQVSAEVLLIGMFVLEIPIVLGVLPAIEQVKISPYIARAIKAKTTKEIPVATYEFAEPSLNFYLGRQIEPLHSKEEVVAWTRRPGPAVLITTKEKLDHIQQQYGTLPLEKIASKKGLNYPKGNALEVLAGIRKTENK